ncbi:hypothetical protein GALL_450290 [mine drainage metagenome]|uniref:Uncharacterized protein n=1 Tax=mine drainage metagenome TaxID=410659 RepID=A0A1J5PPC8_9ZZZZ
MGVGRVRLAAQRVEDPDVEVGEVVPRLGVDLDHVGQVGEVGHTESQRVDRTVADLERRQHDVAASARDGEGAVDGVHVENRRVGRAIGLHEGIAKAGEQRLLRRTIGPDRQAFARVEHDLAQIVDAMHMVGVGMGVNHCVQFADARVKQLVAHVGRGVDQHAGGARVGVTLDQQRAAAAAVFRVGRVASAPIAANAGHAAGGAATEDGEAEIGHQAAALHWAALANRRLKLAVVCAAKSSRDRPNRSAPVLAVSAV